MTEEHVPVLVVGAGPVGLSTAVFLARWGVPALVVDKRDPTLAPPRASVSLRTLELFRAMGLGPALDEVGWRGGPPMRTVFKDSALGTQLRHSGLPPAYSRRLETCSPADARQNLTQRELQQVALRRLSRDGGTVRFGTRLLDFTADEAGVRARVADTDTGAEREITADYLIGADGAGSGVRQRLGITVPDRRVVARLNTAFFRADLGDTLAQWETHLCFVRNEKVYATLFSKNGGDQWSSHIMDYPGKPDELTDLSAEKAVELLHAAIGDDTVPVELHAVNAWEAALGIASAFRVGRVFLAGDAAHVQSSAGGLGMNTGIQDGHNLAWKLAAVLNGQAAPSLLDSYEAERRAAAQASLTLSRRMYEGYRDQPSDPDDLYDAIAVDYLRGMMCYQYRSGAVLADAEPDREDVLDDHAEPGRRFPHHWVESGVSTLDLAGSDWTVFTGLPGTPWLSAAGTVGAEFGVRVRAHRLTEDSGLAPDGAVLVRPDGFVGWRTANLDADPERALRSVFGRILGRTARRA
ncbi:FAD-dependent monooxygenase [Amycolatopsis nigrescens]|uniref:FAD-dependent monooxygenase n=1 Tax=Amycolatopsis nigrescens TaxID=381445 RepID=UPI0003739AA4|nr:FAD-dependent monooxygenase [Amycolatopsis nigrescens]